MEWGGKDVNVGFCIAIDLFAEQRDGLTISIGRGGPQAAEQLFHSLFSFIILDNFVCPVVCIIYFHVNACL